MYVNNHFMGNLIEAVGRKHQFILPSLALGRKQTGCGVCSISRGNLRISQN